MLTGVLATKNRRGVYLEKALEDKGGEGETMKGSQRLNFPTSHWRLLLLLLLLSCFSRVQLCATPETAAEQAPSSPGFSRQEHWSGLPFPSPMHESEK